MYNDPIKKNKTFYREKNVPVKSGKLNCFHGSIDFLQILIIFFKKNRYISKHHEKSENLRAHAIFWCNIYKILVPDKNKKYTTTYVNSAGTPQEQKYLYLYLTKKKTLIHLSFKKKGKLLSTLILKMTVNKLAKV